MTSDEIQAMAADYRSGIGSWRLARKYGVSDSTVLARLESAGVDLDVAQTTQRAQREAAAEEMCRLREEGWSLVAIGEKFGVTRQTVATRIRSHS